MVEALRVPHTSVCVYLMSQVCPGGGGLPAPSSGIHNRYADSAVLVRTPTQSLVDRL